MDNVVHKSDLKQLYKHAFSRKSRGPNQSMPEQEAYSRFQNNSNDLSRRSERHSLHNPHDISNETYVQSDQSDVDRMEAYGIWGKLPSKIKKK